LEISDLQGKKMKQYLGNPVKDKYESYGIAQANGPISGRITYG
jgi:hypothetical protein